MKEVLLLKCGEIVLKGLNRKTFEDRLLKNLKRRMAHVADCEITMRQSVGMKKAFPTVFDESVNNVPTVMVSAGKIGFQIECAPADLIKLTRAATAHITTD